MAATDRPGCFWGTEHDFVKQFKGKGLLKSAVGYIGGNTADPSYRAVCSGNTGHAEAVRIEYDPSQVSYAELVEFNYAMHDPTTVNRQGNDRGTRASSELSSAADGDVQSTAAPSSRRPLNSSTSRRR